MMKVGFEKELMFFLNKRSALKKCQMPKPEFQIKRNLSAFSHLIFVWYSAFVAYYGEVGFGF
ncbi:MAG: hypothetical protein JSU92_12560 [Deltaproteobacteria bacterium]|nr:MAG: hypothetical protein JSU92_12560 [Deltaproteobacteria bacterium]